MRIILKPGGLALLGSAFVLLIGATVAATRVRNHEPILPGLATVKSKVWKPGWMPGSQLVAGLSPDDSKANLLSDGEPWRFSQGNHGAASTLDTTPVEIPGVTSVKGYRFQTSKVGEQPYDVLLKRLVPVELPKGQEYQLHFRAMSPDSCDMSAIVELAAAPYSKGLDKQLKLTKEWHEYSLPFRSLGFTKEGSTVTFFLGHTAGEIDLGDVSIETYSGPIPESTPVPKQAAAPKKGHKTETADAPVASL